MGRNIGGFLAGVLTLGVIVFSLQYVSFAIHPLPEGLDPMDPNQRDAFLAHVATMPALGWLIAALSEVVGATAGAFVAGKIGQAVRVVSGLVVGLGVMGSVNNWISFPHPTWFIIAQLMLYPAGLLLVWKALESKATEG